jgi:hypothetical protein
MVVGEDPGGGGISGFGVAMEEESPLGGTGGGVGPGTRAGEGRPSGENIDGRGPSEEEEEKEARSLGLSDDHDETPALEYGEGDRPNAPTIGEALGSASGTNVGSGTPPQRPIGDGDED